MFILINLKPDTSIYCMSWDNAGISKYVFGLIFQSGKTSVFYFRSATLIEKSEIVHWIQG